MADERPPETAYKVHRIWDRGIGASSRGWHVVEKHPDGTEIPIADFVSFRDAEDWVKWKMNFKASDGR
jgi:hypothetical protein